MVYLKYEHSRLFHWEDTIAQICPLKNDNLFSAQFF